jgi:hypothetical protein
MNSRKRSQGMIGRAKTRLRKAYVAANLKARDTMQSQGRAIAKRRRVSARPRSHHSQKSVPRWI